MRNETLSRRRAIEWLTGLGITSATFTRALAVETQRTPISAEAIANAEWISGITLSDEQHEILTRVVDGTQQQIQQIRAVSIDADISPSQGFATLQDAYLDHAKTDAVAVLATARSIEPSDLPTEKVDIAFASIPTLGAMLRAGKITSVQLTKLFWFIRRKRAPGVFEDRGRDDCCQPPPAQIRTRAFNSYGSCLESNAKSFAGIRV